MRTGFSIVTLGGGHLKLNGSLANKKGEIIPSELHM
jgi:hypothetical protein